MALPDSSDNHVELVGHIDGWPVYFLPKASNLEWLNFKMSVEPRPNLPFAKKTYWFAWNGERLGRNRDVGALHDNLPSRYKLLISFLTINGPELFGQLRENDHA